MRLLLLAAILAQPVPPVPMPSSNPVLHTTGGVPVPTNLRVSDCFNRSAIITWDLPSIAMVRGFAITRERQTGPGTWGERAMLYVLEPELRMAGDTQPVAGTYRYSIRTVVFWEAEGVRFELP